MFKKSILNDKMNCTRRSHGHYKGQEGDKSQEKINIFLSKISKENEHISQNLNFNISETSHGTLNDLRSPLMDISNTDKNILAQKNEFEEKEKFSNFYNFPKIEEITS